MILMKGLRTASVCLVSALLLVSAPREASAQWVEPGGLHNESRRSFTDPEDMLEVDLADPEELMRTWDKAVVWVPTGPGTSRRMTTEELVGTYTDSGERFPTAIYLHGCAGLWAGSSRRMKFLADNGFLAIGPASMARQKYAQSCDPQTHEGGTYGKIQELRQLDAGHAIGKAKTLPFVDGDNMLLIGLSEGGQTTAKLNTWPDPLPVKVRVIEGWLCHSGWVAHSGIRSPKDGPILSLLGVNDPWFVGWYDPPRDCGSYMDPSNGSKSIVYRTGPLTYEHGLLEFPEPRAEMMAFLKEHFDLPLSVREVQELLTKLGYDPGPIDGAWGGKTLAALNALRADKELPAVTELDAESLDLLDSVRGE